MSSSEGKKFIILKKKSDDDQIAKTSSQRNNKGVLPGFISFSLCGKLLQNVEISLVRGQNQDGAPALKCELNCTESFIL